MSKRFHLISSQKGKRKMAVRKTLHCSFTLHHTYMISMSMIKNVDQSVKLFIPGSYHKGKDAVDGIIYPFVFYWMVNKVGTWEKSSITTLMPERSTVHNFRVQKSKAFSLCINEYECNCYNLESFCSTV
jgi:hypothetical protein